MVELGFESRSADARAFVPHHWANRFPVSVDARLSRKVSLGLLLLGYSSWWAWVGG